MINHNERERLSAVLPHGSRVPLISQWQVCLCPREGQGQISILLLDKCITDASQDKEAKEPSSAAAHGHLPCLHPRLSKDTHLPLWLVLEVHIHDFCKAFCSVWLWSTVSHALVLVQAMHVLPWFQTQWHVVGSLSAHLFITLPVSFTIAHLWLWICLVSCKL